MQGDPEVIALLNEHLTAELTAVNQYFLHARMQDHWGFTALGSYTYAESLDEMRHADTIISRVLFLDGLPNLQRLGTLRIGETVPEQFRCDLAIEVEALERLRRGSALCRAKGDLTSANLFETILADEERHIDYLETQLSLIEVVGESNYLARQLPAGGSHGVAAGTGDG